MKGQISYRKSVIEKAVKLKRKVQRRLRELEKRCVLVRFALNQERECGLVQASHEWRK